MLRLFLLLSLFAVTACTQYDPADVKVDTIRGNPDYRIHCSPEQSVRKDC